MRWFWDWDFFVCTPTQLTCAKNSKFSLIADCWLFRPGNRCFVLYILTIIWVLRTVNKFGTNIWDFFIPSTYTWDIKNGNLFFHFLLLYIHLLCISTSKRVLWMLFAGGNPLFGTLKDKSFISEKTISVWICKKNIALEISYKIVALFTENYPSHPKSLFWPVC